MANRMKEDEKNEKIIRGLLKLPSNRRCINCNSLGPQYVCTNFWTFVCTTCSGIHREFTHRIKSVSMAKFSSQEVSALQGGGNERAREIYFKEWDPQRHSVPDSSNVERLRDFIKHVYVDGRYTGERSIDKPPRVKMGEKEDSWENKRVDTYRGGSRSPPYDDRYDRRYSERSGLGTRNDEKNYRYNYDERRSPGYDKETRSGDYKRSPVRFEVVDDRRRDDRYGNGRRFEERRFSDGESKLEGRSPNHQKDLDMPSPPMVRPVRDILGEDVPPLRVGEPPKANGVKASDGSAHSQRTASSSSLGSVDGGSVELKKANSGSLIDFNADPEPSHAAAISPAQPTTIPVVQSVTQPTTGPSIDGDNWASFDFAPQAPTQTQVPSSANTLESLLSQLSAPVSAPVGNMSVLPVSGGAPTTTAVGSLTVLPISGAVPVATVGNISALPFSGGVAATPAAGAAAAATGSMLSTLPISGGDFLVKANDGRPWTSVQQYQPSIFTATDGRSTVPQFTTSVDEAQNNQLWNSSLVQNVQGPLTTSGQPSQVASKPTHDETSAGVAASQPVPPEAKNSGRQELPVDLFAATYSTVPVPVPGWHTGPSHGTGFGMQYPNAVSMPTFPNSSKSMNPFDLNHETTLVHAPTFPSMVPLQGALPNVAVSPGLLRTSSLGAHSPRWMPPQSPSYASVGHSPSYASALPPSAYMGQQIPSNMPSLGHQGIGGFGGEAAYFGTLSTDQQLLAGRYSQPPSQNPFSSLGATLPGHF